VTLQIRQKLIAAVTFLAGLYFFLEYLLPEQIGSFKFGLYHEQILRGVTVVGSMAIGLGLINILRVHGTRLLNGQRGWINSLALLAGLGLMFYVQGAEFLASERSVASWKTFSNLKLYTDTIRTKLKDKPAEAEQKAALAVSALKSSGDELLEEAEAALGTSAAELPPNAGSDSPAALQSQAVQRKLQTATEQFRAQLKTAEEKLELWRANFQREAESPGRAESPEATGAADEELNAAFKLLVPAARDLAGLIFERDPIQRASKLLSDGFFVPLGAAMFSLLAFYIAHAAYRSFRVKSVEASVMMATAVIVILGQIPFGPLYISDKLPACRLWLLQFINTPGNRAIYFGATIAAFAMAVRMWFSLERNPLEIDGSGGGDD
jgi:hypothetical protein